MPGPIVAPLNSAFSGFFNHFRLVTEEPLKVLLLYRITGRVCLRNHIVEENAQSILATEGIQSWAVNSKLCFGSWGDNHSQHLTVAALVHGPQFATNVVLDDRAGAAKN